MMGGDVTVISEHGKGSVFIPGGTSVLGEAAALPSFPTD
jgi:hypothetical protein